MRHSAFQFPLVFSIILIVAMTVNVDAQINVAPADNGVTPLQVAPSQDFPAQDQQAEDPKEMSFPDIIALISRNEREINKLFSSIPIGFPEDQKEHMRLIDDLRKNNKELTSQLESAALHSFETDPTNNPQAAQLVFNLLFKRLEGKETFNPFGALELADMMLKTGLETGPVRYEDVAFQAFRASFAIQDFGRADLMLKKIEERGIPLKPRWRQHLSDAQTKWQRELMLRRLEVEAKDLPQVEIKTSEGIIVVELFENHAPQTVGNFINLVEKGFYDDLEFFRVRAGISAESGCKFGNGTGDAGYKIPCECYSDQTRHHFTGTISMSNNGKDTGGSRFFITHQRNPDFDGKYTAFGHVIQGMDIVYQLQSTNGSQSAEEKSKIIKATVIRKRNHEYAPSRVANQNTSNKVGSSTYLQPGTVSGRQ